MVDFARGHLSSECIVHENNLTPMVYFSAFKRDEFIDSGVEYVQFYACVIFLPEQHAWAFLNIRQVRTCIAFF